MIKGILLKISIACSLLAYTVLSAQAQVYPTIFVMLNSEQNRITKSSTPRWQKNQQETLKDAVEVMRVTKNDFRDHYTVAPVYYFVDTNLALLKKGQLDGIVLNADGSVASNYPKSRFLVAYFGFPNPHPNTDFKFRQGLVILNDKGEQLPKTSIKVFSTRAKKRQGYAYSSKHFDIEYRPIAKALIKWIGQNLQPR